MITSPCYCTREQVQSALDYKETARNQDQVDRAIQAAREAVDGLLHRRSFLPVTATYYFSWPSDERSATWRLWLDDTELLSVSSLTSGGTVISAPNYYLEPQKYGPPYDRIELNRSGTASFGNATTPQRDIAIAGVWASSPDDRQLVTTTSEALDSSETGVDVTNSTYIGVGDTILVDSERMLVLGKTLASVDICGAIDASKADTGFSVFTGTQFRVGEVIQIDTEQMRIIEIAGNALTVQRAWNGTPLAAHVNGSGVWAYRTLEVARGALGTTAASHNTSGNLYVQRVPPIINELAIAEASNYLLQESSGYGRTVGSGENETQYTGAGLKKIREQAVAAYGRMGRVGAI